MSDYAVVHDSRGTQIVRITSIRDDSCERCRAYMKEPGLRLCGYCLKNDECGRRVARAYTLLGDK